MLRTLAIAALLLPVAARAQERPHVLWITVEDLSPMLGCYGDPDAITPHLDALARESVLFERCYATSGVCAPARSCLITGIYPSALGTQWMRCEGRLPDDVAPFPRYLREAGYHCTNRAKTDYNFKAPPDTWDASSRKASWRDRAAGQPFFHVRNFNTTHESKIRASATAFARLTATLTPEQRRDPERVRVPAYYPDTPKVRRDLAHLHELATAVDAQVGAVLAKLEADGLAGDTIVFFFSDHGNGLPRAKRWLYEAGTHVPLLVRFPPKWQHLAPAEPGTRTPQLVSFVDFAATVLALGGVEAPAHLHGRAFLGSEAAPPRELVFGLRDRMDERYDLVRSARGARYRYVRNFRPELPYAQHLDYMEKMPTMQALRAHGTPTFMAARKPVEELYDVAADPDEVHNLAGDPAHAEALARLRDAVVTWQDRIRDVGVVPEAELRRREGTQPTLSWAAHDEHLDLSRCWRVARAAPAAQPEEVLAWLGDPEPVVRFWACVALEGSESLGLPASTLRARLDDASGSVRVAAAAALLRHGVALHPARSTLLAMLDPGQPEMLRLEALNALGRAPAEHLAPLRPALVGYAEGAEGYEQRILGELLPRLDG